MGTTCQYNGDIQTRACCYEISTGRKEELTMDVKENYGLLC